MMCKKTPLPICYGQSYDSECDIDCPFAMDCQADMEIEDDEGNDDDGSRE